MYKYIYFYINLASYFIEILFRSMHYIVKEALVHYYYYDGMPNHKDLFLRCLNLFL